MKSASFRDGRRDIEAGEAPRRRRSEDSPIADLPKDRMGLAGAHRQRGRAAPHVRPSRPIPGTEEEDQIDMASTPFSDDVRFRLAESIAVVERHRDEITRKMQGQLAAMDEGFGQAEISGRMLVDLLLASASNLAAFGSPGDLAQVAGAHRRLGIDGRHYSRFGLSLARGLRDVLGPSLSPRIASAWCDAYWLTIGQLEAGPATSTGPLRAGSAGLR